MDNFDKKTPLDESNEMTLISLSTEASTLTNGMGNSWPEAWNPEHKVH